MNEPSSWGLVVGFLIIAPLAWWSFKDLFGDE